MVSFFSSFLCYSEFCSFPSRMLWQNRGIKAACLSMSSRSRPRSSCGGQVGTLNTEQQRPGLPPPRPAPISPRFSHMSSRTDHCLHGDQGESHSENSITSHYTLLLLLLLKETMLRFHIYSSESELGFFFSPCVCFALSSLFWFSLTLQAKRETPSRGRVHKLWTQTFLAFIHWSEKRRPEKKVNKPWPGVWRNHKRPQSTEVTSSVCCFLFQTLSKCFQS